LFGSPERGLRVLGLGTPLARRRERVREGKREKEKERDRKRGRRGKPGGREREREREIWGNRRESGREGDEGGKIGGI